jgi:hypothetical protein
MEHRAHLKPGLFHSPEARFDDTATFISKCDVLGRQRVIIGDDDELAVELLRRLDLGGVEPGATGIIRAG